MALAGGQERPRRLGLPQAAAHEHLRDDVRAAELGGQPRGGGEGVRGDLQARVHDALRLGAREDGNRAHSDNGSSGLPRRLLRARGRRAAGGAVDDAAVAALRDLYSDLGIDGRVLDVGGSSADHFDVPPDELIAFGGDLDQQLPYGDDVFDDVLCTGAVGALTRPRETFAEVARVLRPGGRLVCTFASTLHVAGEVRGCATDDAGRVRIVRSYFAPRARFGPAESDLRRR